MLRLSEFLPLKKQQRAYEKAYRDRHRAAIQAKQRDYAKTPHRKAKNREAVRRYRAKQKKSK